MKIAGFFLLLSGWMIVLTAIVLLPQAASRTAFVFAGMGVEVAGVVLVARSHMVLTGDRQ